MHELNSMGLRIKTGQLTKSCIKILPVWILEYARDGGLASKYSHRLTADLLLARLDNQFDPCLERDTLQMETLFSRHTDYLTNVLMYPAYYGNQRHSRYIS